jgi:hypothetical protein
MQQTYWSAGKHVTLACRTSPAAKQATLAGLFDATDTTAVCLLGWRMGRAEHVTPVLGKEGAPLLSTTHAQPAVQRH